MELSYAFSLPCIPVSSGAIALGPISAVQRDLGVWLRRAPSAVA
jgi:hypothetical protein